MRDPKAPVAVIIVNWNGADDTLAVLEELSRVETPQLRTFVVDNGSSDDSVERLQASSQDFELIRTDSNLGFAGGNAVGLRRAAEDEAIGWFLLLNNDVAFEPGFLQPLIEACLDTHVGAVGPKIYYFEPSDLIWAAGGRLRVRETVTEEFGKGIVDRGQWDVERDVTYLTTCCLLVPKDALVRVGLFDPMFFIGVEDADWCRRALDLDLRLRYVPASRIWHKVAVSTGGSYTPFKTFHTGRSNTLYARRHLGLGGMTRFLMTNLVALAAAFVRELPRRNTAAVVAKARGIWDGLIAPLDEPPTLERAPEG
ncbi:MAG: glycosyltransferase family 2 protein [Acidobacteriota bacterium]